MAAAEPLKINYSLDGSKMGLKKGARYSQQGINGAYLMKSCVHPSLLQYHGSRPLPDCELDDALSRTGFRPGKERPLVRPVSPSSGKVQVIGMLSSYVRHCGFIILKGGDRNRLPPLTFIV